MKYEDIPEIEGFPKVPLGKATDLTKEKFGKLQPLYRLVDKNKKRYWLCQCDCENKTILPVMATHLTSGHTKSCGCYNIDCLRNRREKLEGLKFNHWTVLKFISSEDHDSKYLCECDCQNHTQKILRGSYLKKGVSTSCGCDSKSKGEKLLEEIFNSNNIKYEYQKTFSNCIFPKTQRRARFDFYLPNKNTLIEYDGILHFETNNRGWNNQENLLKTQEHDNYKTQWCKENNIKLIRIPYTDYDLLDWNYIKEKIEN